MKAAPALAPTAAAAPEGWSARSRPEVEVARGGAAGHDFGAAAPAAGTGPAPGAGIGGGQPLETGARRVRKKATARRTATQTNDSTPQGLVSSSRFGLMTASALGSSGSVT